MLRRILLNGKLLIRNRILLVLRGHSYILRRRNARHWLHSSLARHEADFTRYALSGQNRRPKRGLRPDCMPKWKGGLEYILAPLVRLAEHCIDRESGRSRILHCLTKMTNGEHSSTTHLFS